VELSYLSRAEQAMVADAMAKYEAKPSLSQAVRLRKTRQAGELTAEVIEGIFAEEKKPPKNESENARYSEYFPAGYSPEQIEAVIVELLTEWKGRAVF
jgi:hypothetical protein